MWRAVYIEVAYKDDLFFGGSGGNEYSTIIEKYDIGTDSWATIGNISNSVQGLTAELDEKI